MANTSTNGGTQTTSAASTTSDDLGCYYYYTDSGCWQPVPPNFSCGQPQLCPEFSNNADPIDFDAAYCILNALEARTPATHDVHIYQAEIESWLTYEVLADGSVIRRERYRDLACSYKEERFRLRDVSYFAECAEETELGPLSSCLGSVVEASECVMAPPVCP